VSDFAVRYVDPRFRLTGEEHCLLASVVAHAFDSYDDLDAAVELSLARRLSTIVRRPTRDDFLSRKTVAFDLAAWTEARGLTAKLVRGLKRQRPALHEYLKG
jgi:hypothetical protein